MEVRPIQNRKLILISAVRLRWGLESAPLEGKLGLASPEIQISEEGPVVARFNLPSSFLWIIKHKNLLTFKFRQNYIWSHSAS